MALGQLDALGIGNAHLRAAVELDSRRDLARQTQHAVILHDQGIGARFGNFRNRPRGFGKLMFEHQRVERNEPTHAPLVESPHHFRQLGHREAHLRPGRKMLQAEVNRIRPRLNGSVQLRPVSGRTHDFRFATHPL